MSAELEPVAPELGALPTPREFGAAVQARVDAEVLRLRTERGDVTSAADVYPLVRGLTHVREQLGDYATSLRRVVTAVEQELEEELMAIPGNEQDGTPVASHTVPDVDGTDIKLTVQQSTKRTFDADPLVSVAIVEQLTAAAVAELAQLGFNHALSPSAETEAALYDRLGEMMTDVVARVLGLGSFTPQITKVNRFAKDAAGAGADGAAAVVQAAVHEKKVYTGLKVSREERK